MGDSDLLLRDCCSLSFDPLETWREAFDAFDAIISGGVGKCDSLRLSVRETDHGIPLFSFDSRLGSRKGVSEKFSGTRIDVAEWERLSLRSYAIAVSFGISS